jgi:beta-1,2-mannobiose phosphorylase / 1,2-beta-oligomannan phosphorylase
MLKIERLGRILEPTTQSFETRAVLNPAVYQDDNSVHIIYRAIDDNYLSCLGYAKLEGPTKVVERSNIPFLFPQKKVESKGIEDPRIVKIEDEFVMTYVVHNGRDAVTAFSSGKDLRNLRRGFVLSPKIPYSEAGRIFSYSKIKDEYYFFEAYYQKYCGSDVLIWHKDLIPFPEKINGQYFLLERILPDIQLVACDSLDQLKDKYFWINHIMRLSDQVILEPLHGFESRHLGGGCPPIKTDQGWLIIYHSAQETNKKRVYYAGAALLDLDDPHKVLARLPYPLISPEEDYELSGTVNNVVFPTGSAIFGDDLYIYYGAADTFIAAAKVSMAKLLQELENNKVIQA